MQILCLEGQFLIIPPAGITSLFPIVGWIQSSVSLVGSSTTALGNYSEVPFYNEKPKQKTLS